MGGRGSGLSHPGLLMSVWTVPLQAGKSQTQRSDIWEALGSVYIFRRPDMPRILGVAEPEKQGGQQKVNQKKWPEPATFLTKVSWPCLSQGDRHWLPLPSRYSGVDQRHGLGGHSVQCACSPPICSSSYLVLFLVQMNYWAPGT